MCLQTFLETPRQSMSVCRMSEGSVSSLMSFVKTNFATIAGITGCAFIGYAIYFDRKRRTDPNYKQKIRENRRAKAQRGGGARPRGGRIPDVNNATEMQQFFLQEVQLGEELIAENQVEEGVEHLCNAIMMCGQPQQLLQIFQQTLPAEHFSLIVQKLPETRERLSRMFGVMPGDSEPLSSDSLPTTAGEAHLIEETDSRPPMVFMSGGGAPPPGVQGLIMDQDDLE
uniref:Mitochondrial import receptor subunit TOM20 homolog n=1 Tax=Steinernema glaseri TaxID=37863 RepID=A0A1I7Y1E6_9BILA